MDERRQHKRHSFSATAEVVDMVSGGRLSARAADLNEAGCYLDTLNPIPVGSHIRVRVIANGAEFTCTAVVRDSQPGFGMGVAFTNVDDARKTLINSWIASQGSSAPADFPASPVSEHAKPAPLPAQGDALAARLIDLLHKKGLLSSIEVDSLLSRRTS